MLTTCNITFDNYRIMGMSIKQNDRIEYYYFSKRCKQTLDNILNLTIKNIDRIIKDVLQSLIVLHKNEYYHGDIKAQNIMSCPSDEKSKYIYKIIDWGRLYPINKYDSSYKYGGSMQAGTPLGLYFMIRNKSFNNIPRITSAKLALLLFEGKLPFSKLKCPLLINMSLRKRFKPLWIKIKKEFIKCISKSKNDDELFNKYKYNLDTYNFALTLLYILLKNDLDTNLNSKHSIYNKYYNVIQKMTLYNDNMIRTAEDALEAFKL